MNLIVSNTTIIDGTGAEPATNQSIFIEGDRIGAIGPAEKFAQRGPAIRVEGSGKFVVPGLMNANVHLLGDARLEVLSRYENRYDELIAEAAQVALRNGLTTVFDTWGPRRFLALVRDRINEGAVVGSRIFCAGNIVGFDGPFSPDFYPKVPEVASSSFVRKINSIWAENVGRRLMWLPPDAVSREVRAYIHKGIDFIKYGSNDHFPGAFLAFSPDVQAAIVNEAHTAGMTAQAHTMSVEGLRIAVEAGCDLIQHSNITGPTPIPEKTLQLMSDRKVGAVIFPVTKSAMKWVMKNCSNEVRTSWKSIEINAGNLIQSGARIMLANDGGLFAPELASEAAHREFWSEVAEDRGGGLYNLADGHFGWFLAMEELGCRPMDMLLAATHNIAVAYGKEKDLGTLQVGKIADMLILDKNPLEAACNYRSIHKIIKAGVEIDRDSLPTKKILTEDQDLPGEEEQSHVPFILGSGFPLCCCASRSRS